MGRLRTEKLLHYSIIQLSEFCLVTFESDKSFLGGKKNNIKNFKMLARKALMSIPVRYGHVKAGKPRVHISPMEKAVHMALISVGILGTPLYILANIKNYRGD